MNGNQIVAELDGSGNVVSTFVYGTKGHVPDWMTKGGSTYRLITDQLGSVRLVVKTSDASVVQRLEYTEWGVTTDVTGTGLTPGFQPFAFAGGLYDRQTKLVRFGARDYDPTIGRWVSKDPIGFGGGLNLYVYGENDPVNRLDPSGTDPIQRLLDCMRSVPFGHFGELLQCLGSTGSPIASGGSMGRRPYQEIGLPDCATLRQATIDSCLDEARKRLGSVPISEVQACYKKGDDAFEDCEKKKAATNQFCPETLPLTPEFLPPLAVP